MRHSNLLFDMLNEISLSDYQYDKISGKIKDNLYDKICKCENEFFNYIGTADTIIDFTKSKYSKEWKIQNIFSLGFPFIFPYDCSNSDLTNEKQKIIVDNILNKTSRLQDQVWFFISFCKKDISTIFLGFNNQDNIVFNGSRLVACENNEVIKQFDKCDGSPVLDLYWCEKNEKYLNHIIKVLNSNTIEVDINDLYEFNEIPYQYFNINFINLFSRYKKQIIQEFGYPSEIDKIVKLQDYVKVFEPTEVFDMKWSKFEVEKNDLLVTKLLIHPGLQTIIVETEIASNYMDHVEAQCIIRSKTIPVEYIKAYLESSIFSDYCLQRFDVFDNVEDICCEEPVEIPIQDVPIIITNDYSKYIIQEKKKSKNISELQKKVEFDYSNNLNFEITKKLILEDLDELRICYKYGAYKAAIILAGSILEAFLIDWLSEINHKDYFNTNFPVKNKYQAGLSDYIKAVKYIKFPDWYDAAEKAFKIKNNRNNVHAKVYIKNRNASKILCKQMQEYLEYVISTRWNLNSKKKKNKGADN